MQSRHYEEVRRSNLKIGRDRGKRLLHFVRNEAETQIVKINHLQLEIKKIISFIIQNLQIKII